MNLRDRQQRDLKKVRDDWWLPITLIAPDKTVYSTAAGTSDQLLGDVRAESKDWDPEIAGPITSKKVSITIRLQDLEVVPQENETWFVTYPENLLDSGTPVKKAFTPNNSDVGGDSLGYIKIFPQDAELTT